MFSVEENKMSTETDPGTPMSGLLRKSGTIITEKQGGVVRNSNHTCIVKDVRILALTRVVVLVAGFFILYTPLHAACPPTQRDGLGPFYKPDAPMRNKVGTGYVLQGVVRSADTCQPIPGAQVELWMTGPDGQYQDAYRARLKAEKTGHYRFESHMPVGYYGRPAHIHIRVTAVGHRVLVTQHYPTAGQHEANFDLVLRPE